MINKNIFREYDIRGIAEQDLTDEAVTLIGKGYGTIVSGQWSGVSGQQKVAVGRDVRLSSNRLRDAIIEGITSTGVDVLDVGECPTPLLYFAAYTKDVDGGIMITGSHNPPEYNGFKVLIGRETIHGGGIQELRKLIETGSFASASSGKVERFEVIPAYLEMVKEKFKAIPSSGKRLKAVVDAGNGTGGLVAPQLLKSIGVDVIPLFCEVDGNFPNHHPDPTVPENLKTLIETVKAENADLGVAYDGDSDRIGLVDENGSIIWGDQLIVLFARDILKNAECGMRKGTVPDLRTEQSGAVESGLSPALSEKPTIIGEVKCSQIMYDDIERHGGRGIMWKAGHSLIKDKMKKEKAVLAGEMSGHIFFADRYFGFDDAIYATCRVIEILLKEGKPLSTLLSDLPKTFNTPEIRVDCPDEKKFETVEKVKEILSKDYPIIDIDGVRVKFAEGWGLLRASNTGPILVMRFEASSEERLSEYRRIVEDILREVVETGL
ncbi:MAG: phosphomannomutase/phosphoglucomutase [Deltaproteobacteria bacterium]|nr:phosphomannomutase/phosphoglucomutase [Deltaproteobacteria bacterium]